MMIVSLTCTNSGTDAAPDKHAEQARRVNSQSDLHPERKDVKYFNIQRLFTLLRRDKF
jgi:hypothetical protein